MSLKLEKVSFIKDKKEILKDIDFELNLGENVVLLGGNGAGKTTLIRLILGLLRPSSGRVLLDGEDILNIKRSKIAKNMAYVAQHHEAHFAFKVEQIVEQGLLPSSGYFLTPKQPKLVENALLSLGIEKLKDRIYTRLSGGEQQKVLIARALAQNTPYILLDEPTNNLDYGSVVRLLKSIKNLAFENKTILTISHNPQDAKKLASRVLALKDGRLLADESPQILNEQFINILYDL